MRISIASRAELRVLAPPVVPGELALLAIELGVADLAVLGLLARLERRDRRVFGVRGRCLRLFLGSAKRRGHEPGHGRDDQNRKDDLHELKATALLSLADSG